MTLFDYHTAPDTTQYPPGITVQMHHPFRGFPMKEASAAVDDDEPEDTITDRNVADSWKDYLDASKSHTTLTPVELCSMGQSLIDARDMLNTIDDGYYELIVDSLRNHYFDLALIAKARVIENFPAWKETPDLKVVQ